MKTYVWTLPTRIFHWMLVLFVALAFLTSEEERLLDYHAAFGYGVLVLLLFRFVWGVMGPRYSRFCDWPLSKKEFIGFIRSLPYPKKYYTGHNPAASLVMAGILLTALLLVLSGMLTYGIQEGKGLLAWLNTPLFKTMEYFEEIHEFFFVLLILLIAAHLGGVAMDYLQHKEVGTLRSIFSGYKQLADKPAYLTTIPKIVAWVFLSSALAAPVLLIYDTTPLTQSRYSAVNYEAEHPLFVEECASCHTLYPPHLLPKRSWKKIMATLSDHFGDDASLDEADRVSIEKYLLANSAEHSTKEAAYYIARSLEEKKNDIIAISKSPYWVQKHASVKKSLFDSPKVKSRANCKACHEKFENGLIEDNLIALPEGF